MSLRAKDTSLERLYTADEFEKMPEFDERYELLDGKLVEKPMPKQEHGLIARLIMRAYDRFDLAENVGRMLQEVSVYIRPDYAPTPDLSFWLAARKPSRTAVISARPDLAIEIQPPGQSLKSLEAKAREYIRASVPLVWIIQPATQKVKIYRTGQAEPETVGIEDILSGEGVINGFELPVKALFE